MPKRRIVNIRTSLPVKEGDCLEKAAAFIGSNLEKLGIRKKFARKTELLSEETIAMFLEHAQENAVLKIRIKRFFGDVSVILSMRGEEFDPLGDILDPDAEMDELVSENAIRALLLRSHGEKYKYRFRNGVNQARILTGQTEQRSKNYTFAALFLGVILGLLGKFVFPAPFTEGLSTYLLSPISTLFMNALKIVIAPVVFFSIVTCFSQFNSLSDFGKIGLKVFGMYLLTTVIAVLLAMGVFHVIQPGEFGFALSASSAAAVEVNTDVEVGILPMILNIVPSNFLAPFLESNTLQIIFLAVLFGAAVGMIGQYSKPIKELFEALNSLFLTVTTMITKLIPVVVLASVASMVIHLGGDSFLAVAAGTGTQIFTILLMMCIYGILILGLARLNPINFYRKGREGLLTSFTLSSSSAAMPTNMRVATEKLGISPKVANFSIPLGATINMDGTCIYLITIGFFLARAYGVEITPSTLVSVCVTVILLSLGSPGVPGAGIICLGIILKALNVPVEAIGLVIAVNPLIDMFDTMNNTTGDLAAALIVARSEGLLDREIYDG